MTVSLQGAAWPLVETIGRAILDWRGGACYRKDSKRQKNIGVEEERNSSGGNRYKQKRKLKSD